MSKLAITLAVLCLAQSCTPAVVKTEANGMLTFTEGSLTVVLGRVANQEFQFTLSVTCTSTTNKCNWVGIGFSDDGTMKNAAMSKPLLDEVQTLVQELEDVAEQVSFAGNKYWG